MTRRRGDFEIRPGDQPVQAVSDPILSSPYDEPISHYTYVSGIPSVTPGRRPASYWFKEKRAGTQQVDLFAEEQRDDLPLINSLRADVKRWRESGYRGASHVTKDLLKWWSREDAPRRLFFCQREAVETLIYLLELRIPGMSSRTGFRNFDCSDEDLRLMLSGDLPKGFALTSPDLAPSLIDPSIDGSLLPLRRLGCKMATGSGKTVVMAMLVAWAFCNRGMNPATAAYPNGVLICAPNLTVKKRLQVLRPDAFDNYYDTFEIVPAKYRPLLGAGKVLVVNWHVFSPKSKHNDGGVSYKIVDKGEESRDAFTLGRLGDLSERMPLLVLNDEGHHCWRPNIRTAEAIEEEKQGKTRDEKQLIEDEAEEARLWLEGLDKINNSGLLGEDMPCISATIDMSATPFFLSGSGHPEGRPFPWLVSDFGLVDAIESGIVKIPRLPVLDEGGAEGKDEAGRPDPKYFRLWRHVNDHLRAGDKQANGRPKPEAVYREAESALITLAGQWKQRYDTDCRTEANQERVPPVLIVVCDNTEIAQVFYEKISGEVVEDVVDPATGRASRESVYRTSDVLPEFQNTEEMQRTIRIDSKLLAKIETEVGETKDRAAQRMREIIDTVGKPGQAGEHIRCVVSVSMLTEGWDANNVTHVLGVRAFDSQLLCEQVVGRGLRRRNYTPDPSTGMLPAEHVDVYGIPFSLIPFKGKPKDKTDDDDRPRNHIYALHERKQFEIKLPQVESYVYEISGSGVSCDVDHLEGMVVNEEPVTVYLDATRGYDDTPGPRTLDKERFEAQDREVYYANIHMGAIEFRITQLILDELLHGLETSDASRAAARLNARHLLFPGLLRIVKDYIAKRVEFGEGVNPKELGLEKYVRLVVQRIRDGIQATSRSKDAKLLPVYNSHKPYLSTAEVDYTTVRPIASLEKSHLNAVRLDSDWEKRTAAKLDDSPLVHFFAPNDRQVGLKIPYEYLETEHVYEPDYIVCLGNDLKLLLEVKGGGGEVHAPDRVKAKSQAARKWVTAVNNEGSFGKWDYDICRDVLELPEMLRKHAGDVTDVYPFSLVVPDPQKRWVDSVPVMSLKAAAGAFVGDQVPEELFRVDDVEWWAEVDWAKGIEEGMFVAQVVGRSMEPMIPDGAWCLFGPPRAGSRAGRILLVANTGIADPETGGQYTVKRYKSEKRVDEEGWEHIEIVLEPLNSDYQAIRLSPKNEGDVRVVAEFLGVLGSG